MAPRHRLPALATAGGLGFAAHGAIAAGLAPRLEPLWLSQGVVAVLDRSGLNPRDGLTPGPVTVVGYAEPSLIFALGTQTELGDADAAAEAISEGRPVVVEQGAAPAFQRALAEGALKASLMGERRRTGLCRRPRQHCWISIAPTARRPRRELTPPPDSPAPSQARAAGAEKTEAGNIQ